MTRYGNRRRGLLVLAALVGTLAGSAVAATPAAAGVLGLQLVMDVTPSNSTDKKAMGVPCPRGKVIVSGGAYVDGAEGEVHVDRLRPSSRALLRAAPRRRSGPTGRGSWGVRHLRYLTAGCKSPRLDVVHSRCAPRGGLPPGRRWSLGAAAPLSRPARRAQRRAAVREPDALDRHPGGAGGEPRTDAEAYAVCATAPGMFSRITPGRELLDKAVRRLRGTQLPAIGRHLQRRKPGHRSTRPARPRAPRYN